MKVVSSQNPISENDENPARFLTSTGQLSAPSTNSPNFYVEKTTKQQIVGFGGAMTDSTAILINELKNAAGSSDGEKFEDQILNDYFSQETGNGYTVMGDINGRTH